MDHSKEVNSQLQYFCFLQLGGPLFLLASGDESFELVQGRIDLVTALLLDHPATLLSGLDRCASVVGHFGRSGADGLVVHNFLDFC